MKRAVLSAILFMSVTAGLAQAVVHISLLGGYALPTNKNYSQAFAYGAGLSFDFHKNFAIVLSALRYQSPVVGSTDGLSKGKLAVLPLEVSLRGQFPLAGGRFVPYFSLGAGYFLNQFTLDSQIVSGWEQVGFQITEKLDHSAGYHFGAGLEIALNRSLAVVMDARFHMADGQATWTMTDLSGKEETSGELKKLDQGSIVFGIGLKFSFR